MVGGIIGILIGAATGYIGTAALNSFIGSSAQPVVSLPLILFAILGSFLIGSTAGLIPAMRAARENPVEDIRG